MHKAACEAVGRLRLEGCFEFALRVRRGAGIPLARTQPDVHGGEQQVEERPALGRDRGGKSPRRGKVGNGLVEKIVEHAIACDNHGQLCVGFERLGWKGGERRVDGRPAAEDREIDEVVGEEASRPRPVGGGLCMPNRLDDVAVLLMPLGGPPVQRADELGGGASQLEL